MFENFIKIGVKFPKSNVKLPKNWQKLEESKYNNEDNFAILTGKVNDIIVIDLDNKESLFKGKKWFEENFGEISKLNTLVTKTINNGYHIYYKYTAELKNTLNYKGMYIDILSDKRCVYEGKGYEVLNNNNISFLDDNQIKLLKETKGAKNKNIILKEEENIRELIMGLNKNKSDNYDDWVKIGLYLTNITNGKEIFRKFSERSKKYNELDFENKWLCFENSFDKDKSITIGTIMYWLKDDNPDLYNKYNDTKIINELDVITKPINASNSNVFDKKNTYIKSYIEPNIVLEEIHNLKNNKCKCCELYTHTLKNLSYLKCDNCDFKYPENGMAVNENNAPYIFNTLIIKGDENMKSKETEGPANYIIEYYQNKLLFHSEDKYWLMYNDVNGIYENIIEAKVMNLLSNLIKEHENELEWFMWLKNITYKEQLIRELKNKCDCSDIKMDYNKYLLGFLNGVYDLERSEFRIGKKDEYITMKCGIEYNDNIDISLAQKLLDDIFINSDERNYVIDKLALTLDGINREQKLTFNYGYTASNGKSFLMERMREILGDYGGSFPVTLLTGKMKGSGEANSSLSDFINKRFMYCSEPESGSKLNSNMVKQLTGDIIKTRGLYQNKDIEIRPTFKIFVCCNSLPNFDSYDEGISRRICIIEFKTKFCENPKKKNEKLIKRYSENDINEINKSFIKLLIERYKDLLINDYKYKEPESFRIIRKIFLNDNKGVIKEILRESLDKGFDTDYVKLIDIKNILYSKQVKEKDVLTIIRIILDEFEDVEFKENSKIHNKQMRNYFKGLRIKN